MGIIVRQSILSSILLYLGAVIGYVNLLYFFPKFLSAGEIGITRTVQDMAALLVPVAQFGLAQSILRFYPKLSLGSDSKNGFLTFILLAGVICYLIFVMLFSFFKDLIASYFELNAEVIIQYFPLVLAIIFLLIIYNLLVAYTQSLLNIVAPNFIKDILFRVSTALLLIAFFFRWLSFDEFLIAMVASYGLMTLSLVIFLLSGNKLHLSLNFSFLTKSIVTQLFIYSLFSVLGASGMLIIGKIDSIMVTSMLGVELNGIYTTVFYIAVVIELPKRAINQISLPLVSRAFEKDDISGIQTLYRQSSINQLMIGSLLFLGIWINLDTIFALMPNGEIYATGKMVVLFIGLGRILDMAAGINSEIIVMSRYYKFNMVLLVLLAVITILLNLYLIPTYGIVGAAVGSAAALIFFNIAKLIFLKMTFGIQPFTSGTLVVLGISAVTVLIGLALPQLSNPYLDLIYRSLAALILFTALTLWMKPSPEVDVLVKKLFRYLVKK